MLLTEANGRYALLAMGLGFSVGSGVRVYGGGRGLGVSVGKGPVRYSTRLGGGSRSSSGRTSAAAYEREVRAAERMEEVQAVLDLDNQLVEMCHVHREEFEPAQKPGLPGAQPVDPREVKARLEAEAVEGIGMLKFGERRAAKTAARERLDEEVVAEEERRAKQAAGTQQAWDEFWGKLQANDAEAVLPALERAFEDNEAPAAAVSCRDGRVDVVMRWSQLDDVVSERKAAVTPTGKPTIKKRSKSERYELYLETLCSHALVTAKEAFAVAPKIERVGLAVVRATTDPARGDDVVEPVLLGLVSREDLERIHWTNINATAALLCSAEGRIGFKGKGANKTLYGLDLSDDPDEREFIAQVAGGLGARVPGKGVAGVQLPVRVVVG